MRLIDANILRDDFDPEDSMEYDAVGVRYIIDSAPTIDPIRAAGGCQCGECINYEAQFHGHGYCYHWDYETGMSPNSVEEDDFCSYGEPRQVQEDE